jgi:hypothetical protein
MTSPRHLACLLTAALACSSSPPASHPDAAEDEPDAAEARADSARPMGGPQDAAPTGGSGGTAADAT